MTAGPHHGFDDLMSLGLIDKEAAIGFHSLAELVDALGWSAGRLDTASVHSLIGTVFAEDVVE